MTDIIAAEGGTSNFLVPNATFFVELFIFMVVLGVIWKFVVPPIREVLEERERLVAKTAENNQKATQVFAEADSSYQAELNRARADASEIRDEARAEGQQQLDAARAAARAEVAGEADAADAELNRQSEQVAATLRDGVGPLSVTLANRVLGVEANAAAAAGSQTGRE